MSVRAEVYLVGARWRHHARHSGYEHFAPYVRGRFRPVNLPVVERRDEGAEAQATAILAGLQLLGRSQSTFHVLDGDRDLGVLSDFTERGDNRLVATLHNPPSEFRRFSLERPVAQLDAAVLVSGSQRSWFSELLPPERLFAVPHGVDTRFFLPAPRPTTGRSPILITVGEHLRDFPTLARALDLLWRSRPEVRVVAVGVRERGKRLLARSGAKRMTFLDEIGDEQLRDCYRMARAAVLPFTDATANNALLEAMACGAPIVATDVGGVPEYVGTDALLCPPGDASALAEAIGRLLEDEPLARALAEGARARALQFDYEHVGRAIESVYRTVMC